MAPKVRYAPVSVPPPPSAHVSTKSRAGSVAASQAAPSKEVVKSPSIQPRLDSEEVYRSKLKERWYEYEYDYPRSAPEPPAPAPAPPPSVHSAPPAPPPEQTQIPVLFCHTCSECGRLRSAGFHRANPVIPGKPVVPGICRRCVKKSTTKSHDEEEHSLHKVTHIRKCTADEPCDWPTRGGSIHIHMGDERRGRRRSRSHSSDVLVIRRSRSRAKSAPRVIMRNESKTRMGLGALQDDEESMHSSAPVVKRRRSMIRIASASPPRIGRRTAMAREISFSPLRSPPRLMRRRSMIRVASASPARGGRGYRTRHIDIMDEDDDFLPPPRRAATTAELPPYETQTQTYRNRFYHEALEQSPPSDDGHPHTSYRTEVPRSRHQARNISPDTYLSTNAEAKLARHPMPYRIIREPPPARIEELPDDGPPPPPTVRPSSPPHIRRIIKEAGHDRDAWYRREQHFDRDRESNIVEPDPPRVQFSRLSRWPGKGRIDQRIPTCDELHEPLPSPPRASLPSRRLEDLHIRHVPPRAPTTKARSSTPHPGPPPPPSSKGGVTNSDSEGEGDALVTVRTYKGIDENGEPVTYVEERRTRYLPEREHEEYEYRGRRDRERGPMPGSWREV